MPDLLLCASSSTTQVVIKVPNNDVEGLEVKSVFVMFPALSEPEHEQAIGLFIVTGLGVQEKEAIAGSMESITRVLFIVAKD